MTIRINNNLYLFMGGNNIKVDNNDSCNQKAEEENQNQESTQNNTNTASASISSAKEYDSSFYVDVMTILAIQNGRVSTNSNKVKGVTTVKPSEFKSLPQGLSKFKIDDDEILIFRDGNMILSEVRSSNNVDFNEIYQKIANTMNLDSLKGSSSANSIFASDNSAVNSTQDNNNTSQNNNSNVNNKLNLFNSSGLGNPVSASNDSKVNGEFDEDIVQGTNTGDCWLIAGLLSLSSTSEGRQIIKDSITENSDGSVKVTFKGIKRTYTISAAEIQQYDTDSNITDPYSNGDNDMLVFEIATDKLLKDISSGKITLEQDSNTYEGFYQSDGSINGGFQQQILYYTTGKTSDTYTVQYNDSSTNEEITNKLRQGLSASQVTQALQDAADNSPASINFMLYYEVKKGTCTDGTIFQNDLSSKGHAYAVKNIDKNNETITFVNPWDTSKEYTMTWENFANMGVGMLSVAKLDKTVVYEVSSTDTDYDPKVNGDFDEKIEQGNTNDSWLITGLLGLYATDEGKDVINKSIKVNSDGSATVTFKGLNNIQYTVSADEIKQHDTDTNKTDAYSNGDNDMLVMEIAIEKLVKDIASGSVTLNCASSSHEAFYNQDGSINGGYPQQVIYYLTGKMSNTYQPSTITENMSEDERNQILSSGLSNNDVYSILKSIAKNNPTVATFCMYGNTKEAVCTNGENFSCDLQVENGSHSFSISSVDTNKQTVTFVNSWDSSKEYTMTWENFASMGIGTMTLSKLDKVSDPMSDKAQEALESISDAEFDLIFKYGIDLTEKFDDGSPKFIIAKGKSDGEYHIYEYYKAGAVKAQAIARKYCPDGGYTIVHNEDGFMTGISKTGDTSVKYSNVFSVDSIVYHDETDEISAPIVNALAYAGSDSDASTPRIDSLQASGAEMNYQTVSPLSFDLDGDGVKTSAKEIIFDIDGDGILDNIFDSSDGVLVFDADGNGISGENGKECFGNNSDIDGDGKADGFTDGFKALKALAEKEGLVDGINDNKLDADDINTLERKYGFKIKANGYDDKAISLFDFGITEINLGTTTETTLNKNFDGLGDDLMTQDGATFKMNGEEHEYADIWHRKL